MVHYHGIIADFDNSLIGRQARKSKRLAVFVASLQCDDEVKAESRKKSWYCSLLFWHKDRHQRLLVIELTLGMK